MAGWIKLHREFLEWEWYDDNNTKALFIHCLLKANHKPNKWRGKSIERGEFVTSLEKLKTETGMTIQKVRTCLSKLEKSDCLMVKSNTKFTVVSVCKYDVFQGDDESTSTPPNKQITNEQQTNNKQITTNKNEKKEKNEKEVKKTTKSNSVPKEKTFRWEDHKPSYASDEDWSDYISHRKKQKAGMTERAHKSTMKQIDLSIDRGFSFSEIVDECSSRGWKGFKDEWMRKESHSRQNGTRQIANESPRDRNRRINKEKLIELLKEENEDAGKEGCGEVPESLLIDI